MSAACFSIKTFRIELLRFAFEYVLSDHSSLLFALSKCRPFAVHRYTTNKVLRFHLLLLIIIDKIELILRILWISDKSKKRDDSKISNQRILYRSNGVVNEAYRDGDKILRCVHANRQEL